MDTKNRNKELFANAMSNLMNNKLGMSIDLLNEILRADPDDKLALLARGSVSKDEQCSRRHSGLQPGD